MTSVNSVNDLQKQQDEEIEIFESPTPNPNAIKYICSRLLIAKGNANFEERSECQNIPLLVNLFSLRGVDRVHLFENTLTVTKFNYLPWEELSPHVIDLLKNELPQHSPEITVENPEEKRRESLSPTLLAIEEILDKTIRPGLQGDGGDLECLEYRDNNLIIRYQGACGTCPSSSSGTLEAIKSILREQFNPDIEVFIAPS